MASMPYGRRREKGTFGKRAIREAARARLAAYWTGRVDLEALLVALVLVPQSYPRNRFFGLYEWPAAERVRRRAARLRGVVQDLACATRVVGAKAQVGGRGATIVKETRSGAGQNTLVYRTGLNAIRTTKLRDIELVLVHFAVDRAARIGTNAAESRAGSEDILARDLWQVLARLFEPVR